MGSGVVGTDQTLQALQSKVDKLERKLNEFDDRVRLLVWIGGLLAVVGLTASGVAGWVQSKAIAVEKRLASVQELQKKTQEAQETLTKVQAQIPQAQQTVSALEAIVNQKKQELRQYSITISATHTSKPGTAPLSSQALPQLALLKGAAPQEPYYQPGQTNDVGQMYNCIDLFIAEMKSNRIPRDFQSQKPVYDAIEQLYATLLATAQSKITPTVEPDPGSLAWHTRGWFDKFRATLTKMKQESMEGKLTDGELQVLDGEFRDDRDSLWGPTFHDWPRPF